MRFLSSVRLPRQSLQWHQSYKYLPTSTPACQFQLCLITPPMSTDSGAIRKKRASSDATSSDPVPEGDHRKRRRNRTTQSCLNCHTSKRMVCHHIIANGVHSDKYAFLVRSKASMRSLYATRSGTLFWTISEGATRAQHRNTFTDRAMCL